MFKKVLKAVEGRANNLKVKATKSVEVAHEAVQASESV